MSKMSELEYEQRMAAEPKFAETYCSQCGQNLGPGDSGVSHCKDHMRLEELSPALRKAAEAVIDRWFTPNWTHDAVHTGELIAALRDALQTTGTALQEYTLVRLSNTHQQLGEHLGEVGPKIGEQFGEQLDIALTERMTFNHWWNEGEVSPGDNPYTHETAAYWAWEGWQAGAKAEREACAKVVENYAGAWDDQGYALSQAIRARGKE